MQHPEHLFEKLINDEISRSEFEQLLAGLDDPDLLEKYEYYLEKKFNEEIELGSEADDAVSETSPIPLKLPDTEKSVKFSGESLSDSKKGFPIAASVTLFIGLVLSALFIKSQIDQSEAMVESKAIQQPATITKSTPYRRTFRMRLDDGSLVHLNAASTITYPQHFEDSVREINVTGEAFFEIERDERRPFNIRVSDYSITVLGTAFNVKAYEGDEKFSVTVESGSVQVNLGLSDVESVVLVQGDKLTYSTETGKYRIKTVNVTDELGWREGILKFDSTSMPEVKKMLEHWYGVSIELEGDEIAKKTLTGIHKNENLRSVIEAITFATGARYEINDNTIVIMN